MNTQSHVVWDCKYHVVIVPKYRKKVLYGKARRELVSIIKELAKQKGIEIVEGSAKIDHVHMVMSIPPKFSISHTMGFLKGKSAIKIHNRQGKKKRLLQQKSFWSRGYFVRTTGIDENKVLQYVRNQHEKDVYEDGNQLDFHW